MPTKEDIQDWQGLEVTKVIMQKIIDLIDGLDEEVHTCLVAGQLEEAARINKGIAYLVEITELPGSMIEDLEEEK